MTSIKPSQIAPRYLEQLGHKGGAFLIGKGPDGTCNAMTIGWGSIGYAWNEDTLTVLVRQTRFTKPLIDASGVFTVSVPLDQDLKAALSLCGTKSGRDMDKFAAAGLTLHPGQSVDCPIIEQCALHFECQVVLTQEMEPGRLAQDHERYYADHDYHTMYTGKITACYLLD
ncbi:MAG: flavin reductase family protein [Eubacteriales bacterium]|nr:flavin reductase family protein [Eubacteriales bacterium]